MTTRSDFIDRQLDEILKREGWPRYTNRAADRGGPTKGGVTLKTLSAHRGRSQTIADLQAMHVEEARRIYRKRYLDPWEFVQDDDLFTVLVDYAVTSGHDDPAKAVQQALGITVDGVVGPVTRAAMRTADPAALRLKVIGYRVRHMVDLALNDPKLKRLIAGHHDLQLLNLRGWIRRSTEFL
jgi:lysozyme family protein